MSEPLKITLISVAIALCWALGTYLALSTAGGLIQP